jgi:hypothetical protein
MDGENRSAIRGMGARLRSDEYSHSCVEGLKELPYSLSVGWFSFSALLCNSERGHSGEPPTSECHFFSSQRKEKRRRLVEVKMNEVSPASHCPERGDCGEGKAANLLKSTGSLFLRNGSRRGKMKSCVSRFLEKCTRYFFPPSAIQSKKALAV